MVAAIFDLSKTPASNTSIGGSTMAEGMSPASVNDGIRSLAALLKKWQEDIGGALTTGGSANAYTLTTNSVIPSSGYAAGMSFAAIASFANTGAATMNVDARGSKKIRKFALGVDVALDSGDYPTGHIGLFDYLPAGDAAAGALMLRNPADKETITLACSDETTAITATTDKIKFRMPYPFTLSAVRGSLSTAQSSGNIFTVDVNDSGTTILSTKLTIDNNEKTTTTALTPLVISDTALGDDAEITVDVDQIGNGTAKGLKVYLIGVRTG